MRTYHQLTQDQRYQIWELKKTGMTQAKIAREIGVHKSTLSREIKNGFVITSIGTSGVAGNFISI